MSKSNQQEPNYSKAKRVFVLNLALCSVLAISLVTLHYTKPEETIPKKNESLTLLTTPQKTPLEIANQLGQAHGLSEDPRVYHPLSDKQLSEKASQTLEKEFEPKSPEFNALVKTYCDGYRARYNDYYSPRAGYNAGLLYGIKVDPTLHSFLNRITLNLFLEHEKSKNQELDALDEVQWHVFKGGFQLGYQNGYMQIKEGITAKIGERIPIIAP
jgi:hypothetical protein